jgi:hypothetical protein
MRVRERKFRGETAKNLCERGTNSPPDRSKQAVESDPINLSNPAIAPYMAFNPC